MSLCCMEVCAGSVGAVMSLCCMAVYTGSVGAVMSLCCMAVCTGSVGASGSSPACLQCRGHLRLRIACGCGRPSSRPYSYAVERCGDLQCTIIDCPYRQCRGEWKLARVASAGGVYGRHPLGDRLRFRVACVAGDLPVAPTATRWSVWVICNALSWIVHAGSAGVIRGYALRVVAGDLPVAPTATRWSVVG